MTLEKILNYNEWNLEHIIIMIERITRNSELNNAKN